MNSLTPALHEIYLETLKLLESGQNEAVSETIAQWRSENRSELEPCRRLLAARLALKSGNQEFDVESLMGFPSADPYLKAEARFVLGLSCYQSARFSEGFAHFESAADLYRQADRPDRVIISRYNAFIGRTEALGGEFNRDLSELLSIQQEIVESSVRGMLGVILRQKSYLFFDEGRRLAALHEATRAIEVLELEGPHSDHQLALIHAADCCVSLGRMEEAQRHLEYLHGELDDRARFPLAYVRSRIEGTTLKFGEFSTINPYWRRRAEAQSRAQPIPVSAVAESGSSNEARSQGLEARLIRELATRPQSRTLLCEKLWPQAADPAQLANRFYRLVNRVNRRHGRVVRFNGQAYSLEKSIQSIH